MGESQRSGRMKKLLKVKNGETGILEMAKPSEIPQFSWGRTRFCLYPAEILVPINALEGEPRIPLITGTLNLPLPPVKGGRGVS
jgi:hypothetical protein